MKYHCPDSTLPREGIARGESETARLAERIAAVAGKGDLICLRGSLGTGKTTFARAFISTLCENPGEITSPTFALLHTYESRKGMIWHFDLYRLKSAGELLELGLEDALREGITLIEWPEIAEAHLPAAPRLDITFAYAEENGARYFHLAASGDMVARLEKGT